MFSSPIIKCGLILFFLGLAGIIVFFSHMEDQSPELYLARQQKIFKGMRTPEERLVKEYTYAEGLLKAGRLEEARQHFNNVYRNYPSVPKGFLKLRAVKYLDTLSEILDNKNSRSGDRPSEFNKIDSLFKE